MSTLSYLYFLTTDRRLINCTDKQGCHYMFANEELARDRAAYESIHAKGGYPVIILTEGNLHNTRDRVKCNA